MESENRDTCLSVPFFLGQDQGRENSQDSGSPVRTLTRARKRARSATAVALQGHARSTLGQTTLSRDPARARDPPSLPRRGRGRHSALAPHKLRTRVALFLYEVSQVALAPQRYSLQKTQRQQQQHAPQTPPQLPLPLLILYKNKFKHPSVSKCTRAHLLTSCCKMWPWPTPMKPVSGPHPRTSRPGFTAVSN